MRVRRGGDRYEFVCNALFNDYRIITIISILLVLRVNTRKQITKLD